MKKRKILKSLAVFGTCLCAPLLLTGCMNNNETELDVDFRVDGGWIQYTTDGVTWLNLISTSSLKGKNGTDADVWTIEEDGYWYLNGEKTNDLAIGTNGNGIKSITKDEVNSTAEKSIYIIELDDGSEQYIEVLNGKDGNNSGDIYSIGTDGYWYKNGAKTEYKAIGEDGKDGTNGTNGTNGKDADLWSIGTDGYWYKNGAKTEYKAIGEDGKDGTNGTNGTNGKDADLWSIGTDGYWYKNGAKTEYKAIGEDGKDGTNGTNGTNGKDAVIDVYTITYDYGAAGSFFTEIKTSETIKATQWLTTLPKINDEYKDSFLGWFVSGTDKQIKNYDFIGASVTLEARFDIKIAPAGLYQNGKYVKTWSMITTEYSDAFEGSIIKPDSNSDSYFENLSGELVIDNTITKIKQKAFYNCNQLTGIVIPSSVTYIECFTSSIVHNTPFSMCKNLSVIEVKNGNEIYHSAGNCLIETNSKELIVGSINSVIPSDGSVTAIGNRAFYGNGISKIVIPKGVLKVCGDAFVNCENLKEVSISNTVIDLDYTTSMYAPFRGCPKLTKINVDEENEIYHSAGNCLIETESKILIAGTNTSVIPTDGSVVEIGAYAFSNRAGLTEIIIPNSIIKIGKNTGSSVTEPAFAGCINLIKIEVEDGNSVYHSDGNCIIKTASNTLIVGCKTSIIPADGSVTEIGEYAFYNCSELKELIIPEGITRIGANSFEGCTGLAEVVIPSTIKVIAGFSLDYCFNLKHAYYKGTSQNWEDVERSYIWNVYFYSETQPAESGNYWHYDSDGVTPVIW